MTNIKVIHWFRQDLRLSDNPSLHHASKNDHVLPVYILDNENSGDFSMGGASRFWLHHSLKSLNENLNNNFNDGLAFCHMRAGAKTKTAL